MMKSDLNDLKKSSISNISEENNKICKNEKTETDNAVSQKNNNTCSKESQFYSFLPTNPLEDVSQTFVSSHFYPSSFLDMPSHSTNRNKYISKIPSTAFLNLSANQISVHTFQYAKISVKQISEISFLEEIYRFFSELKKSNILLILKLKEKEESSPHKNYFLIEGFCEYNNFVEKEIKDLTDKQNFDQINLVDNNAQGQLQLLLHQVDKYTDVGCFLDAFNIIFDSSSDIKSWTRIFTLSQFIMLNSNNDNESFHKDSVKMFKKNKLSFSDSSSSYSKVNEVYCSLFLLNEDNDVYTQPQRYIIHFYFQNEDTYKKLWKNSDMESEWNRLKEKFCIKLLDVHTYEGVIYSGFESFNISQFLSFFNINKHQNENLTTIQHKINEEITEGVNVDEIDKNDGTAIIYNDIRLSECKASLRVRHLYYKRIKNMICQVYETLKDFSLGYTHFGLNKINEDTKGKRFEDVYNSSWIYREWIPAAKEVALMGDMNEWNRENLQLKKSENEKIYELEKLFYKMRKKENMNLDDNSIAEEKAVKNTVWTVRISNKSPHRVFHKCKYRINIKDEQGDIFDRVSPWSVVTWKNEETNMYDSAVWNPSSENKYKFKYKRPHQHKSLKIYECHVGIAHHEERICTYTEFTYNVIPRIKRLGYNTILLIGIPEHSDYCDFGFHVTNFFAATSRFGSVEELKKLIDICHSQNISVLLNIIHSHASQNTLNGLNYFDGTADCFFSPEKRGVHPQWNARMFDFSKPAVLHFLLSNLRFFIEEYMIDGFRFEGVSAMLYKHRCITKVFSGDSSEYFGDDVDEDAIIYLKLANELIHELLPNAVSIASEYSDFPALCEPSYRGGLGFDYIYRLDIPNIWNDMIQNVRDEDWCLSSLLETLSGAKQRSGAAALGKYISCIEDSDSCRVGQRCLKIAMFSWESLHTHAVGGVAPHVTELAAGLARLGHEVHVYVRATGLCSKHEVHYGVYYHECTFTLNSDFVAETENMCNAFTYYMEKTEEYMRKPFDICHAHDWLVAKVLQHCKRVGRVCIFTMHSTEFGRCGNNSYEGTSKRIRDIESLGCHVADRVICVSGALANEVSSQYGVHAGKIKVIYNGIHCEHFDGFEDAGIIKNRYGIAAMDPMFLFVGRLVIQKGPDLLVDAVPYVLKFRGDVKFVIVGEGHMKEDLVLRAKKLNVEHAVRFVGKKEGNELKSLFKAADAIAVPSRNEPFGIVVLESWSACKPVVATVCGGPRDFVTPNVDGVLVDPCPSSISWGCCEILKNFEHSRWMGGRGRVKAAFNFNWNSIARITSDVYYEQLNLHDIPHSVHSKGGVTAAFALMASSMYEHMSIFDSNEHIHRGLSLHKLMRLLTFTLADRGYLNFMGNEFAHSEWIEMPRSANNFSFYYARTRWDLADNKTLKFKHMELWDAYMIHWEEVLGWLSRGKENLLLCDDTDKIIAYERANCIFIFNFHPTKSYEGYQIGCNMCESMRMLLNSDDVKFGGFDRLTPAYSQTYPNLGSYENHSYSIKLYLPSRTAIVLTPSSNIFTGIPQVLKMDADEYVNILERYKRLIPN